MNESEQKSDQDKTDAKKYKTLKHKNTYKRLSEVPIMAMFYGRSAIPLGEYIKCLSELLKKMPDARVLSGNAEEIEIEYDGHIETDQEYVDRLERMLGYRDDTQESKLNFIEHIIGEIRENTEFSAAIEKEMNRMRLLLDTKKENENNEN